MARMADAPEEDGDVSRLVFRIVDEDLEGDQIADLVVAVPDSQNWPQLVTNRWREWQTTGQKALCNNTILTMAAGTEADASTDAADVSSHPERPTRSPPHGQWQCNTARSSDGGSLDSDCHSSSQRLASLYS